MQKLWISAILSLLLVSPCLANTTANEELTIETLSTGDTQSAIAKSGDTVSIHYTGLLTNGITFDSSIPRGTPLEFKLGGGNVIAGFENGIIGMHVGEKRKLTIPPHLAYGSRAIGPIPANSTLIFEIELVSIK